MLVFLYLTSFGHLLIAIYVYSRNRKNWINISFGLLAISISLWSLSNIRFFEAPNPEVMTFWALAAYNIATVMAFCLYLFCTFITEDLSQNRIKKFSIFILTIFSLGIVYIPNFVFQGVDFENKSIVTGPGVFILFLTYFIYILLGLIKLWKYLRLQNDGIEKTRLKIIFIALTLSIFFGILFNIIFPTLQIYKYVSLGPSFTLILLSLITYSILKYQLFDTRLVLGKITYYTLAAIPAYFTYFILAFFYESIFGTSFNNAAYIIGIPVALLFTAFLGYFNRFIGEYTDSHLINPGYNPLLVLEQLRERLAGTLDIERIIQEVLFIVARTIRPNFEGIIIIPENIAAKWISVNYKNPKFEHPEEFKSLVYLIQKNKFNPITYEDLVTPDKFPEIDNLSLERIRSQMEKYKVSSVVPLRQDYKITGLLILGQKEAGAPYTNQELKFLKSVATTASLAIGRALLYQEIQIFNETLQQKVNSATGELREKNKDLGDALAKLEDVRRQEKDMLDVMGHELRTPISIARNALFTLKKEVAKEEENKEKVVKYADMAIESVRREIGLVEAFLSTTKLEADRMQVEKEKISLKELVTKSMDAHQSMATKNKTEVVFNPSDQDVFVIADKLRVQEIMDNFLNNAIKYTGIGKVEVMIYKDGGLGWVDVKDNGIGISEEDLKKLGLKFFRARTLYNKSGNVVNPSGTGLGLFVSFNLIELMGGQKKIVSKVGEGSTFSFGLPLASDAKPS